MPVSQRRFLEAFFARHRADAPASAQKFPITPISGNIPLFQALLLWAMSGREQLQQISNMSGKRLHD
jgi:hypothetical protein